MTLEDSMIVQFDAMQLDKLKEQVKALKEENETLKADKALLMKTVSAGALTVKELEGRIKTWRDLTHCRMDRFHNKD